MTVKKVLTIAGSDSGGGAGIQADLKTITALGSFGMSVVTAITAQNTLGVQGYHEIPAEFIEKQFESVAADIGIDAAKTGMLVSPEIVRSVAKCIRHYRVRKLAVDPVMIAKGGKALLLNEARDVLVRELIPLATVVTPNVPEAEVLTGMRIRTVADMKQAALRLKKQGVRSVVIKGGHLDGDPVDLLYDGKIFHEFPAKRIDSRHSHGTGCTFAAAIATGLANDLTLVAAVTQAKIYVAEAIRFGLAIGRGQGPVNHFAPLFRESERLHCLREVKGAVDRLKAERAGNIIPEVQSNLGYALCFPESQADICAVPGRILRVGAEAETLHEPAFGASSHIARVILAVMHYDPEYRSAMNIRCGEDVMRALKSLRMRTARFDRADESAAVKTKEGSSLEWGTLDALSHCKGIPDAVYDLGDLGKEPMIRIIGRHPAEVVDKVLKISKALKGGREKKR